MSHPHRKRLSHETPLGIPPEDATFFITICAAKQGTDTLAGSGCGAFLIESVRHRHANGIWWCRVFVVMPDHVHGLIRFPSTEHTMSGAIQDFKKFTARNLGIRWQRDFFDHRLRHEESEREKADYILRNPERAGLVDRWESWPFVFIAQDAI